MPGAREWAQAFTDIEAADAVALMTIHRSKGLVYHTVFFLGLDEDQWWAYQRDVNEATSTFFVGLSRAAHRLIFTCTAAGARSGKIAALYHLLDEAGVPETASTDTESPTTGPPSSRAPHLWLLRINSAPHRPHQDQRQMVPQGSGVRRTAPPHEDAHSRPTARIGLDLLGAGISTDSARGPETTGNNRHVSDNADTETGYPTPESADPPSVHRIREPAGQATGPAAP